MCLICTVHVITVSGVICPIMLKPRLGLSILFCMTTRWHCSEREMRNNKLLITHFLHTTSGWLCLNSVPFPKQTCHNRPNCHEAQWTNLIGLEETGSLCVYICVCVILLVTIFILQILPHSYNSGSSMETFWLTVRKTLAELNVCHSTFGICLQEDLDVGCGDVSLLVLIPAHSCPAVAFVFFYDIQQLALCHGNSAFVMTCNRREREKKEKILQD